MKQTIRLKPNSIRNQRPIPWSQRTAKPMAGRGPGHLPSGRSIPAPY